MQDAENYADWYDEPHPAPGWLPRFVYGLPERHRSELAKASYASGVGCNATVTTLALAPLAQAGVLEQVVADVKVGSSEAGARATASSHHPERSGSVRSFKPTGHRHQAEIRQALGSGFQLEFSVTSVELVRGALVTAHCFLKERIYPDPKLLAGSNYCDIGFAADERSASNRVVVIAAIDNLMKGAAGSAVQCMNIMMGLDEAAGLDFPGLHPI